MRRAVSTVAIVGLAVLASSALDVHAHQTSFGFYPGAMTRATGENHASISRAAINSRALRHDTRSLSYRSPFGAVPAGTPVTLTLRTARHGASRVVLRLVMIDQAGGSRQAGSQTLKVVRHDRKYDFWQTIFTPKDISVYGYDFLVQKGSGHLWYADTPLAEGGVGQAYKGTPPQVFHLTSYDPSFKAVSWAPDMVVYQIFPDRFANGDPSNDRSVFDPIYGSIHPTFETSENAVPLGQYDFFGGDLQGIIDKLPYLKGLGVNTLYLNPVFLAPSSHKYDTSDYYAIDPHFGTMQTFMALLQAAHANGMHVILDGVFNHTGSDSVYFNEYGRFPSVGAYQAKTSPYFVFYNFENWPTSYDTFPNASNLPQLAENDATKDFVFRQPDSVAQHWLTAGADGWRLDAATYKSHAWWQQFRSAVKARFPDDILICECDLSPRDAVPWLLGNEVDGAMNYRFRDAILRFFGRGSGSAFQLPSTVTGFFNALEAMIEEYPLPALYSSMNVVDSHDTSRILTELRGNKQELRQVATFQMTWLGAPTIYYGDEAGLVDAASPDSSYVSRNFFPWSHPDAALEEYYGRIAAIRMANPALRDGMVAPLVLDNKHRVLAFLRHDVRQSVVVVINDGNASRTVRVKARGIPDGSVLRDALSGKAHRLTGRTLTVRLRARSTAILVPGGA